MVSQKSQLERFVDSSHKYGGDLDFDGYWSASWSNNDERRKAYKEHISGSSPPQPLPSKKQIKYMEQYAKEQGYI
jgi:hypothetical protein